MQQEQFDRYRLGIPELDNDHWDLLSMLGDIDNLVTNYKANRAVIGGMLTKILEYLRLHCMNEESYMFDIKYPRLVAHMKAHAGILKEMSGVVDSYERNQIEDSVVMKKLALIFMDHIDIHDMQIAQYANSLKKD